MNTEGIMQQDDSVPFRFLPRLFWKPITNHAREACGFGAFDRYDMLCFGWLCVEVDLGVFRPTL